MENERFTVVCFTLMFGTLSHRILLKCVPHVQHAYFSSFNQSDHRLLVLPLPPSLLKFPVSTKSVPGNWLRRLLGRSLSLQLSIASRIRLLFVPHAHHKFPYHLM